MFLEIRGMLPPFMILLKKIADLVLSATRMCTTPKLLKLLQLHILILDYTSLVEQLSILALKVLGLPPLELIFDSLRLQLTTKKLALLF